METRPPSRIVRNCLNPSPSLPSRFSLGMRQSSKISSAVEEARTPNLFSFLPMENPGVPVSTMNELIFFLPSFTDVTAVKTAILQYSALVMKRLLPLTTYSFPSRTAVVSVPPASEPALGSVSPNAPRASPDARGFRYFIFCSSVPKRYIGIHPSEMCAAKVIPCEPHTREISSTPII